MLVRVLLERVCSCYLLEEIVSAYVHIEAVNAVIKKPQNYLELFLISGTKRTGIYTLYIYIQF